MPLKYVQLVYIGGSSENLILTTYFVPPVITGAPTPITTVTTLPGSYYIITASSGAGGYVSPSGSVSVPAGGSQTFAIAPEPCYSIADVKINGVSQGPLTAYTFNNVNSNQAIYATFTLNTLAITASASAGGTINPNGTVIVNCTDSKTFSISPNSGYYIQDVVVDGISVGSLPSYTFSDVTGNHTITANFAVCTPVNAGFTANPMNGSVPFAVQFTDQSTGSPTTWQWNFGDGSANSSLPNPSHTYTIAGTYTVTLTASKTTLGCSSTSTKTMPGYIIANPPCTPVAANFIGSPTSGPVPLNVQFTDLSTGNPTSWAWNFGDGSPISNTQNPLHQYTTPGPFSISLNVSNGCSSQTRTLLSYISPYKDYSGAVVNLTKSCGSMGYMKSGTYYEMDVKKKDSIVLNGITYNLNNGDIVRLVINGDQNVGRIQMRHPDDVIALTFNIRLYINGVYQDAGVPSSINIGVDKNHDISTLTYELQPCISSTNLLIDGVPVISGTSGVRISIQNMEIIHDNSVPYGNVMIINLNGVFNQINCEGDVRVG